MRYLRFVPLSLLAAFVLLVACGDGGEQGATPAAGPKSTPSDPATGKIAFESDRDGNAEVYIMNADGSGQTRLTDNLADDCCLAWSPDGSRIGFASSRDDPNASTCSLCNYEIYTMNADGTGLTRLTDNLAGDFTPVWSPDGSRIAFYSERDGNVEIYVMNSDGTSLIRLTNNPANDGSPAWSPAP